MHIDYRKNKRGEMPRIDSPELVGSAMFWNPGYKTFEGLVDLVNIHTLEIIGYPDNSLQIMAGPSKLRYLRILHLPKVKDLTPLAKLAYLESLALETLPSWDSSGKVTEVASFDSLGEIKALRHVQFFGVRPVDKSLAPLERCTKLVSGRFSKFPKSEVARFYATTGVSDAYVPGPVFDAAG